MAGSIGPTNKQLSIAGNVSDPAHRDVTFDQMVETYYEQIAALVEGGVDLLLTETAFDTLVLKACLFAIDKYFTDKGVRLPVMASFTVFDGGRTLSAQTVEACWNSIAHADLLSVGINCALGPDKLRPYIEELSQRRADLRQLLSERRLAQRVRPVRRNARHDGPHARRICRRRLAEHRRRLLRLDAAPTFERSPTAVADKPPAPRPPAAPSRSRRLSAAWSR